MVHRIAKVILTGVAAVMIRELVSVYYDHTLEAYNKAKEEEEKKSA